MAKRTDEDDAETIRNLKTGMRNMTKMRNDWRKRAEAAEDQLRVLRARDAEISSLTATAAAAQDECRSQLYAVQLALRDALAHPHARGWRNRARLLLQTQTDD